MSKAFTIRDVAREAGVGVGTVSRVLNSHPAVSEETRQRVLTVIDQMEFRPSRVARQLSTGGKSRSIGIIAPFFTRPAYVGRLEGVEYLLADSGYDLILYNVETPEQRDDLFHRVPLEKRVDGLLIISLYPEDEAVRHFKRNHMPVVLVDSYHPELPSVRIDDISGGRQATEHLVNLGHQRIAFISDDVESPFGFKASANRLQGFRDMLEERGVPFNPLYHRFGEYGRAKAHQLADELLALEEPPTAIFATSDTQALGVIEAIQAAQKRVPEDISVIGYDDLEVAQYVGLTTISQPFYESGIEGARVLFDLLDGNPETPETLSLPVTLVIRQTTGLAKGVPLPG